MPVRKDSQAADVVLRDGSTVHVRPLYPSDESALLAFLKGLSHDSLALRFFSGAVDVQRAATSLARAADGGGFGLVAASGRADHVVGQASYHPIGGDRAEVAFAVADEYQGRGLGTILLAQLAEVAQGDNIQVFTAEVLPENHRMVDVFRESGFTVAMRSAPGAILVEFPTSISAEAQEQFDHRDQVAAAAALRTFLAPRSVAVVGASRQRGSIGGEVFHNLITAGFPGPVYPVNPKAPVVQSVPAYASVEDIPGPVDLAVIVVPAMAVVDVARQCAAKGVRALVVISAGFSEAGPSGIQRQADLVEVCREAGMRIIGPNCMGILNTDPGVNLNATFAPVFPPRGRVGFMSQSGALGLAVIDYASALGLGISSFVSAGNKADISGNDLIHYWEADEATDLIVLYLESFGNPRKFARIARRVGRTKPIIAVKSGRSAAGARATSSHTGALLAASDVTVDALFRQTGVIRTDTLHELFDVASLLENQPLPTGNRVAILTNSGGPAILCADACEAQDLQVPPTSEAVRKALAEFLPSEAALGNPVDMIASASAEDYRRAILALASDPTVDAVVVIFTPPLVTQSEDVARAIRTAAKALPRPIPLLTVFMSARGVPQELRGDGVRIPSFAFPEDAATALAAAVHYSYWRRSPPGTVPTYRDVRKPEAAAIIATALGQGAGWLKPDEVTHLLACYGLPLAEARLVKTPEEAGRAAQEMGGQVALKAVAPTLLHKTEAHGVALSLGGSEAVIRAANQMVEDVGRAGHQVQGFVVQRMVPRGVEMLVGVVHDRNFGPVVACGAGGTAVELLKDVSVRITPLTDRDAEEMVRSLATFPLLQGYRGNPGGDIGALEGILLRVAAMVEAHPEVAEMDLNPVVVLPKGAAIVDARVRVDVPPARLPVYARSPPAGSSRSGMAHR